MHGAESYCAEDSDQLFRVYGYTGGRQLIKPEDSDAPKESKEAAFTLDCYHYASNGKVYGPVSRQFTIGQFPGFREISCLPVYPLDFRRDTNDVRKQYTDRAQRDITMNEPDKVVRR